MKHCPNDTCRYRRSHGHAAEYRDSAVTCSDCGTALQDGGVPEPEDAVRPSASPEVLRRLLVTIAAPLVAIGAQRILLPTIDEPVQETLAQFGGSENLSVVALGLLPILSSAVVVECVAAVVPPWRRLRIGGAPSRAKLWTATLVLSVIVAVVQAWALSRYITGLGGRAGIGIDLLNTITLVAGTFLLLGLVRWVDRKGLGCGMSVMLLGSSSPSFVGFARGAARQVEDGTFAPGSFALLVAALVAIVLLLHRFFRGAPAGVGAPALQLPIPASGVEPLQYAAYVLMLPTLLGPLLDLDDVFLLGLRPGSLGYAAAYLLIALAVAMPFALWFNGPKRVGKLIAALGPDARDPIERARVQLRNAMWRTGLFVAGVAVASSVVLWTNTGGPVLKIVGFAVGVAVVMDLLAEWRARRDHRDLVPVWQEHRVYAAEAIRVVLERGGIPTHLRAMRHRVLLQFFGPFIPIDVFVPVDRVDEARALIRPLLEQA